MKGIWRLSVLSLQFFCESKIITKWKQKQQQYKGTYHVLLFQAWLSTRFLFLRDWLKVLAMLVGRILIWIQWHHSVLPNLEIKEMMIWVCLLHSDYHCSWGSGSLPLFPFLSNFQSPPLRSCVTLSSLGEKRSVVSLFMWLKLFYGSFGSQIILWFISISNL